MSLPDHECVECGLVGRPFHDVKRWYHYRPFEEVWLCHECREPYFLARIRGVYPGRENGVTEPAVGQATLFDF